MSDLNNVISQGIADPSFDFSEALKNFRDHTFRELTTGSSGLSLAQLVASAAEVQMLTLADARSICRIENIPERGGMEYHFQYALAVAGGSLTEGTDLTASDITLGDETATLTVFAIRTDLSDIVARQAGVNLAQIVGEAHGNAMSAKINADIYTQLKTATTTNTGNTLGSGSDATVATLTWASMFKSRQKIASQRGIPNGYCTSPLMWFGLLNANITSVQFTAAMKDYISTGKVAQIMGMDILEDVLWGEGFGGTSGEKYAACYFQKHSMGLAVAEDTRTAIQRWEPQVGFRVVTHNTCKSTLIVEPWVCLTTHV